MKEIIETTEPKVLISASSGSGKTHVLTERAKYLIRKGETNIVILTFTNAAAAEMKTRIEQDGLDTKGVFIGTIHGYANYLLLCAGYSTNRIIANEDFDALFELIMTKPNSIQKVNHLLLDESQDSSQLQFSFILDMIKPLNYFFVFDIRQSIYGFNGAFPEYLMGMINRKEAKVYTLNINHRSKENILSFAKEIIEKLGYSFYDHSIAANKGGQVFKMEFNSKNIIKVLEKNQDTEYKDWFILVRSNRELDKIFKELTAAGYPCDTFRKAELDNNALERKLKENTLKILTIHSAKGLEANNVIVGSFPMRNAEEIRVGYVAATRAKDRLYWFEPKSKKKKTYSKIKIENWE